MGADEFSTIIVGAGLSGSMSALNASARSTLLLEAGGTVLSKHEWQSGIDFERTKLWTAQGPFFGSPDSGLKLRPGGRSLCWHGIVLRMTQFELSSPWPLDVVTQLTKPGGAYDLLENHLAKQTYSDLTAPVHEHELELCDVVSGHLGRQAQIPPRAIRRHANQTLEPYSAIEPAVRLGVELRAGVARSIRMGRRDDVVVETADGREFSGKNLILAAGAIENARLAHGVQVAIGASGKTRVFNLWDHIVQGFLFRSYDPELIFLARQQPKSIPFAYWVELDIRCNGFMSVLETDEGSVLFDIWLMGESDGRSVSLEVNTRQSLVKSSLSPNDKTVVMRQGLRLRQLGAELRRPLKLAPSDSGSFEEACASTRDLRDDRGVPYIVPLGNVDHEGGTLPLGGQDVDDVGALRVLPSIRVVGPAIFPTSGWANPSLTTMALAQQFATTVR
jgi:hypothetical protein